MGDHDTGQYDTGDHHTAEQYMGYQKGRDGDMKQIEEMQRQRAGPTTKNWKVETLRDGEMQR